MSATMSNIFSYNILNNQYRAFDKIVKDNKINYIVHSAAILSAAGEKDPMKAIPVNVNGTINAFNIAKDHQCQIF